MTISVNLGRSRSPIESPLSISDVTCAPSRVSVSDDSIPDQTIHLCCNHILCFSTMSVAIHSPKTVLPHHVHASGEKDMAELSTGVLCSGLLCDTLWFFASGWWEPDVALVMLVIEDKLSSNQTPGSCIGQINVVHFLYLEGYGNCIDHLCINEDTSNHLSTQLACSGSMNNIASWRNLLHLLTPCIAQFTVPHCSFLVFQLAFCRYSQFWGQQLSSNDSDSQYSCIYGLICHM